MTSTVGVGRVVGGLGPVLGPVVAPVLAQVEPGRADRIDESVRRILENPPYLDEPGLLERFLQWLVERGLVSGEAVGATASILRVAIPLLVLVLLGWLAWLVVRRLRVGGSWRGRGEGVTTTTAGPERHAAQWLADARAARADGDHRVAVRAAYRALVVHLVDLEAVPALPGATVGAHREAMLRRDVVAGLRARGFDEASDVFEGVWYAEQPADADDADVVIAAAEAVGVSS